MMGPDWRIKRVFDRVRAPRARSAQPDDDARSDLPGRLPAAERGLRLRRADPAHGDGGGLGDRRALRGGAQPRPAAG